MTFPLVTRREYQRVVDALKLAIVVIDSQPANRKAALADDVDRYLAECEPTTLEGLPPYWQQWRAKYRQPAGEQDERIVRVKQSLKEAL